MAFNESAFMKQGFESRTAEVEVPALAAFFDDGEKPVWVVRGQTANEMAKASEASATNKNISSIVDAIGNSAAQVEKIRNAIGLSDDVPGEIVKRLNQLTTCSVEPKIDYITAVKLAKTFPIEFHIITGKIVQLTGMGMVEAVKKPKDSGTIKK